ncbi:hypothetical protein [Mangrovibrevibacter kandeliae]|uniref:hypothetical protein n=1 Tax=Mangrovibrevibacter kandeliae TaxID=2968473 RepID=UPI0021196525|nr:hypothetical protein [Aurantimonas sp. CSK15Z-1]MCQ8782969.1 hypothetical protein [Aurantimonas sp. CSK15Z-1]
MRVIRALLRDRSASFAALVLAVQILLLQGLIGGMACSLGAASAGEAVQAICHGADTTAGTRAPAGPARDGCCQDCVCGVTCSTTAAALATLPPVNDLGAAYTLRSVAPPLAALALLDLPRPPEVGLKPDPTGPPAFSA